MVIDPEVEGATRRLLRYPARGDFDELRGILTALNRELIIGSADPIVLPWSQLNQA